jgi:acyl-CoA synthetase (AMP-forming)/AMP-acid ligase II
MADNLDMEYLWHYVRDWAEKKPDAEALVFGDTRMTWKEFDAAVDRTARAFLEAGVGKGDRVAMVSMARIEFMTTFMAASKVGAIWLGLSPKFTADELRYILGHSQPTVLITLDKYMDINLVDAGITFGQEFPCIKKVLGIGEPHDLVEDFGAFVNQERPELEEALAARTAEIDPDDDVLLMYTSGSTGKPKGVLHSQRNIIENIRLEVQYFGFDEDTRSLLHFPINHVAADVEIGFGAIFGGSVLVMMDHFDPQTSLETIEKEGITVIGQVPVMFLMQMQAPKFKEMDWSKVKAFIWGGAAAPKMLLQILHGIAEKTGARLLTGYGSTELCGFATYSMPDDSLDLLSRTAGKVVAPFEMRIVDENRNDVPQGTVGEIAMRGPSIMKGYLNNATATAAVIDADGWFYTSDLGYLDEEDNLVISGRSSEMFKTGGENVFPREVEDVLESHPAVLFAAVIGVPDELYQEVGHAFIMMKPGQESTGDALRAYCKERLANFKVPKHFDLRPVLPLLPNGKVNKMALKRELGLVKE